MTTSPNYVAKPVADLPAKVGRPRSFNEEAAKAMLAIIADGKNSLTDGVNSDQATAQKSAALAKRTIAHVAGDLKIRTRVYASGEGFEWAVYAVLPEPTKAAKK